ncbi:tRNA (5-methylaminomethyl-2-thiouridine)(34)-methyltransferase MnmD [Pedobacter sp. Du54]|uniref:tRNA (5-methylaminomethyl-2-thiouridine)(34)-methyltransferase MnmD n=1 Tax=Pedobacter anseongensis TaxID=3133439 RepID=UPI0030A8BD08
MNILIQTADGSNTLFNETIGEHYHSSNGALQESKHVFIAAGLEFALSRDRENEISILEVGFGTGLNFLLSFAHCEENYVKVNYTGIEAFPLPKSILKETAYNNYVSPYVWEAFLLHYENCLNSMQMLSPNCSLEILPQKLDAVKQKLEVDLIYYDAFSVSNQPEMWTDEIIAHVCSFLKPNGIFVSYAITGNLKRALKNCGFKIEKLPGAPGKREMLRAVKSDIILTLS